MLHDAPIEIGPATDQTDPFKKSFGTSKRKGQLAPIENRPKQEDILNAILPPREWVENGKSFVTAARDLNLHGTHSRCLRQALDTVCEPLASEQN